MSTTTWTDLTVTARGARLAAQHLRAPAGGPTVLLLGGATWSRDWWPDDLCSLLAHHGLGVVRYDPRDTGASTLSPVGAPDYDDADLAADAIAVLDAVGVDRAVLAGLSMGGGLAQRIASTHPDRVVALALLSTTLADDVDRALPAPSDALLATFDAPVADPDWTDREAVVDHVVDGERPYAGRGFDEPAMRGLVGRIWDRTPSMAHAPNHLVVAGAAGGVDLAPLRCIPTVVLHGTADPLLPLAHGAALAAALGADLIELDGVGHELPPRDTWGVVVDAIAAVAR